MEDIVAEACKYDHKYNRQNYNHKYRQKIITNTDKGIKRYIFKLEKIKLEDKLLKLATVQGHFLEGGSTPSTPSCKQTNKTKTKYMYCK